MAMMMLALTEFQSGLSICIDPRHVVAVVGLSACEATVFGKAIPARTRVDYLCGEQGFCQLVAESSDIVIKAMDYILSRQQICEDRKRRRSEGASCLWARLHAPEAVRSSDGSRSGLRRGGVVKTLKKFKRLAFHDRGESDSTLTVEYDNAGDPFREGLAFVFEQRNDHIKVMLDDDDLRRLFDVLKETLFPMQPWVPQHGDVFPEGCEYRRPGVLKWAGVPRSATKPEGWDNAQGFEYRIPDRP